MLIKELCEYYDNVLVPKEKVPDEGFSKVNISCVISLDENGNLLDLIDVRHRIDPETDDEGRSKKKKTSKVRYEPRQCTFPERQSRTAIATEYIDHRGKYILGFEKTKKDKLDNVVFVLNAKAHKAFRDTMLNDLEGLDSPIINAVRLFTEYWVPEEHIYDDKFLAVAELVTKSGIAFCLNGDTTQMLQDEPQIVARWKERNYTAANNGEMQFCPMEEKRCSIAMTHPPIKNMRSGQSSGCKLSSFNEAAYESYGLSQSLNSGISERAAYKYGQALNYLLSSPTNNIWFDDSVIVYWSSSPDNDNEKLAGMNLNISAGETADIRNVLQTIAQGIRAGIVRTEYGNINPGDTFHVACLKGQNGSSRISVTYHYANTFGKIIKNIADFQDDIRISENDKPIPLRRIRNVFADKMKENDKVPEIIIKNFLSAMIEGKNVQISDRVFMESMNVFLRNELQKPKKVKEHKGSKETDDMAEYYEQLERCYVPVRLISGYITRRKRKLQKGQDKMGEKVNVTDAYKCGQLFYLLEDLQTMANLKEEENGKKKNTLNSTLKDKWFSGAMHTPGCVFPTLIENAEYYLKKLKREGKNNCEANIGNLISELSENGFPQRFNYVEQGEFIVGYYKKHEEIIAKRKAYAESKNQQNKDNQKNQEDK